MKKRYCSPPAARSSRLDNFCQKSCPCSSPRVRVDPGKPACARANYPEKRRCRNFNQRVIPRSHIPKIQCPGYIFRQRPVTAYPSRPMNGLAGIRDRARSLVELPGRHTVNVLSKTPLPPDPPPLVVLYLTLYPVAPLTAPQLKLTCVTGRGRIQHWCYRCRLRLAHAEHAALGFNWRNLKGLCAYLVSRRSYLVLSFVSRISFGLSLTRYGIRDKSPSTGSGSLETESQPKSR